MWAVCKISFWAPFLNSGPYGEMTANLRVSSMWEWMHLFRASGVFPRFNELL